MKSVEPHVTSFILKSCCPSVYPNEHLNIHLSDQSHRIFTLRSFYTFAPFPPPFLKQNMLFSNEKNFVL